MRPFEHLRQARGVGGRGGEADRGDAERAQLRAERVVLLGRDIDADHPIDAGGGALLSEPVGSAPHHRVGIAHQHQRHLRVTRPERGADGEDIGGGRACPERADVRRLDRGTVGHRIGEGHPQLDHIRAARDQRVEIGRGVAIARGDEADEHGVGGGEG